MATVISRPYPHIGVIMSTINTVAIAKQLGYKATKSLRIDNQIPFMASPKHYPHSVQGKTLDKYPDREFKGDTELWERKVKKIGDKVYCSAFNKQSQILYIAQRTCLIVTGKQIGRAHV